jgi:hypothetical protein
MMDALELERQTAHQLTKLRRELADRIVSEQITAVGQAQYDALREHATVTDFIPLLVYRFTKNELLADTEGQLHNVA